MSQVAITYCTVIETETIVLNLEVTEIVQKFYQPVRF